MIGAIMVDGPNLAYSMEAMGSRPMAQDRIDFDKLPRVIGQNLALKERVDFQFRCFYASYRVEADLKKRESFDRHLRGAGWTIFNRQCKRYSDGRYADKQTDLDLALDAYKLVLSGQIGVLVLVTHDSDFAALFSRSGSVDRYIVGWESRMARELPEVAVPIFLENIFQDVRYV
jgi:uncharacterized LabA/DUF88 family protein